ncbi:ferredoxin [Leucobacter luti]|nr:ferredoxin [Leucobacter luti]MBL3699553.1 ferredoxin [Leucobacter luti]
MKIVARQQTCIGSGQCVFTDPDAFDQDDDGKVQVLRAVPQGAEQEALARQAAQVCPSRSISVVEGDG